VGSGISVQGKSGVTISHWQGVFTTSDGQELLFKGRDMSKNNKLNQIPVNLKVLVMNGYERINSLFQTIPESDSISFGASLLEEYE
jgi:hypothetical protein